MRPKLEEEIGFSYFDDESKYLKIEEWESEQYIAKP